MTKSKDEGRKKGHEADHHDIILKEQKEKSKMMNRNAMKKNIYFLSMVIL